MTTKTQDYVLRLLSNHPGLTDQEIATLASVSAKDVRDLRFIGRRRPRAPLAPTYSPFAETAPPVSAFEDALKAASKFATVHDAAATIGKLDGLLVQARAEGDLGAEGAVVMRALTRYYRALGNNKVLQAEAFRRFIAYAMGIAE